MQIRYLHVLSVRQNKVTTSLRRRYLTLLWSCHIVAMETSDDVAKTTLMQHLIMTSLNETLQRRRFWKVVRRFHRNHMTTSEWRWIATSQQLCNDIILSTGWKPKIADINLAIMVNWKPSRGICIEKSEMKLIGHLIGWISL